MWMLWAWPKVALPEYPRDRRTVAYHEAGHAVLSHMLRLPMTGARVHDAAPGVTPCGIVNMDQSAIKALAEVTMDTEIPQPLHELVAVELAAMYVAGTMAELKLHGLEVNGWLGVDSPDFKNARSILCDAFEWDGPLYYCQRLASAVLTENWPWVVAVADEINAQGSVTAEDIARLQMVSRETVHLVAGSYTARYPTMPKDIRIGGAARCETADSTRTDAYQGTET
jgi:hypothetical protein